MQDRGTVTMSLEVVHPLRVELFGGLRLVRNKQVAARLQPQKPGTLLAYLAYYCHQEHPREQLIELLWPEADPRVGRNRLKQTLSVLRSQLEPEKAAFGSLLQADRTTVRLNPALVTTDVAEFEAALQSAALAAETGEPAVHLAHAVQLYHNGLLPGFYDEWVSTERERLAEVYIHALLQLAGLLEQAGDMEPAMTHLRRAIAVDPLREEVHCALMRLYRAQSRSSEALRQYRELERILRDELGEKPSPAAQALFQDIKARHEPSAAPRNAAPPLKPKATLSTAKLEPVGGAVPLPSEFYIVRATDREFETSLARRDSIVLVKGPRNSGKTSLLARGLQQARDTGAHVVLTDFQKLTADQLRSADSLFFTLAEALAEQLELEVDVHAAWNAQRGWNVNFERFLRREVLGRVDTHLVWGLDEVDRLFTYDFGTEVFGLFRSWHNERSLNPAGPWAKLTLAMAYATEAHLFITDLNQSPFNVGTRLLLANFTLEQVAELNRRYGSPLRDAVEAARYYALVEGNPYLVRRGLHEMVTQRLDITTFEAQAQRDDGPFHDHLYRLLTLITQDDLLSEAMRAVLQGQPCPTSESFYRLRSAGVLRGDAPETARLCCQIYRSFLERHLLC